MQNAVSFLDASQLSVEITIALLVKLAIPAVDG